MPLSNVINVDPATPVTLEMMEQYAQILGADGITGALSAISDATTNQALVTVPAAAIAGAVAGSVFYLHAFGITSMPASAPPTLAFDAYSGGSAGTALATMTAFTPTVSLAAALWDVEAWVTFYSTTTAQALVKASIASSTSTAAANTYLAGSNSATPVTVPANTPLTLNAVMGSAVASSSFQGLAGFWSQES